MLTISASSVLSVFFRLFKASQIIGNVLEVISFLSGTFCWCTSSSTWSSKSYPSCKYNGRILNIMLYFHWPWLITTDSSAHTFILINGIDFRGIKGSFTSYGFLTLGFTLIVGSFIVLPLITERFCGKLWICFPISMLILIIFWWHYSEDFLECQILAAKTLF